mmetsp:Transcript_43558/g.78337  ORF Transcript_43558/g.78337 Transcript_43558/m.78337 type:complete len:137 (-) Transcript_43558:90-500(-)
MVPAKCLAKLDSIPTTGEAGSWFKGWDDLKANVGPACALCPWDLQRGQLFNWKPERCPVWHLVWLTSRLQTKPAPNKASLRVYNPNLAHEKIACVQGVRRADIQSHRNSSTAAGAAQRPACWITVCLLHLPGPRNG